MPHGRTPDGAYGGAKINQSYLLKLQKIIDIEINICYYRNCSEEEYFSEAHM